MDKLYFVGDIRERYQCGIDKARELMQQMPCLNLGTERYKKLAIRESDLERWELQRAEDGRARAEGRKAIKDIKAARTRKARKVPGMVNGKLGRMLPDGTIEGWG